MDEGRSRSSQEEDEALRALKQMKIVHQGQDKEVVTQPEPQAWLPAPMLHWEPLMDSASLKDLKGGGGGRRRLNGRRVGEISTTPCRYGLVGGSEEAGSLPQH